MKAAKWVMRAITVIVICAVAGVIVMSAVLGRQARVTMKEEKKAKAKSSYEEKKLVITEPFVNIDVQAADDMDVKLKASEDGRCVVDYFDSDEVVHSVYVQDDTLTITCDDQRTFGSDLGFGDDPYIVISIPEARYGQITLVSDSGDISSSLQLLCDKLTITEVSGDVFISGAGGARADIQVKSGDVTVATMEMDRVSISGESGDFSLMNIGAKNINVSSGNGLLEGYDVVASNTMTLTTDRGDIAIEGGEAATMWISTGKGDVDISLLSDKYILADSNSGDINLPESSANSWEKCIVRTDSGSISLKYVDQ